MSSSTRPISEGSRSFQSRTRVRIRRHAAAMSAWCACGHPMASHKPCFQSTPRGTSGHWSRPTRAGLNRLPDVDERMPEQHRMRAVWSPADGVGKAGFLRTGDEVVDEHAESARGPRPELLDDVDEIVDAAQPLDHHALDPQVVPPDLLDELRVVPSLDVDAAGHRDACPPRR